MCLSYISIFTDAAVFDLLNEKECLFHDSEWRLLIRIGSGLPGREGEGLLADVFHPSMTRESIEVPQLREGTMNLSCNELAFQSLKSKVAELGRPSVLLLGVVDGRGVCRHACRVLSHSFGKVGLCTCFIKSYSLEGGQGQGVSCCPSRLHPLRNCPFPAASSCFKMCPLESSPDLGG